MEQRDQIMEILAKNSHAIRGFGVRSLALFGSYARGEASADSDLDFLVEFEKKSFDGYMDFKAYLEGLFGRKVDLVLADAVKPRLRSGILAEAVHAAGF